MEIARYKLKDIVTLLNGRAYLMPELQDSGKYRILRVGNLSGGNDSWYYSDMELDEGKYCSKGDLLYAWACNFGPHIWKEEKVIYHYHVWKLIEDKQKVDKLYLYYYLLQQTPYYLGGVNGATMVHITKQSMEKKTVFIPKSLSIQRRIASILSAYDNLIENNNKRIRLLEQMAENLYKEWFVRFRFPGHEKVEMVNGLPKGWKVLKMSKVLDVKYGKDHSKIEEGNIPILGSGGVMRYGNKMLYSSESVLIPRKGSLNNIMYINEPFWTVDTMFYTEMKFKNIAKYLYYVLSEIDMESFNSGAALPSMTTIILNHFKVITPSEGVLSLFDEKVSKLFALKKELQRQNDNLTRQRDLLLPRLMSGKLEVKE